jgi:hypothetical protein
VFSHTVRTQILSLLEHSSAIGKAAAHAIASGVAQGSGAGSALAHLPAHARPAATYVIRSGFVAGLNDVFLIGAILVFVSAACTLVLIRGRDFEVGAAHRQTPESGASPADQPRDRPTEPVASR